MYHSVPCGDQRITAGGVIFSAHQMGSWDATQVVGLEGKGFSPQSSSWPRK